MPMKVSHKLCVRMDGTQFFYYDSLQPKMSTGMIKESMTVVTILKALHATLFYTDLAVILTWPQYRCHTKLSIPRLQFYL